MLSAAMSYAETFYAGDLPTELIDAEYELELAALNWVSARLIDKK